MSEIGSQFIEQGGSKLFERVVELEDGGIGKLGSVELDKAQGHLPVLNVGNLEKAKVVEISFPGIGVPTLNMGGKLFGAELPGIIEAKKKMGDDYAAVVLLNWPGYGLGELNSNVRWPEIEAYTLEEKAKIIESVTELIANQTRAEKILVTGHSTGARVLFRNHKDILAIDPRIMVIAKSPSGVGADGMAIKYSEGLATKNKLEQATLDQIKTPDWMSRLMNQYLYGEDDVWLKEILKHTPPKLIQTEMAIEAMTEEFDWNTIREKDRFKIVIGKNDHMVSAKKLSEITAKYGVSLDILPDLGHLLCRERGKRLWANYLSDLKW